MRASRILATALLSSSVLFAAPARAGELETASVSEGVNKPLVIAAGVVAGSGVLVGGALLGIFAYKPGSDAEVAQAKHAVCPPGGTGATGACKTLADTLRLHDALANGGLWTLVSGGVLGAVTLVYGFTGGPRAPRPAVRVQPVVTGDGGGLVIGGSF